ncbi:RNA_pol_sigma70 domain-containing protein [Haematococcus lacustris]|uniref:RNA_pol_sigma70 domain-containing protein n=1 Tax=Haematococcus lacustris TaxID=44745 RepID=A0A699ZLY3_HAELA|nr:RNA_pol_sigma70 domain-containing protein [Haematococcus lacustris]
MLMRTTYPCSAFGFPLQRPACDTAATMLGRTLPSAIPTSKCCWGVPVARWLRQPRCVLRAATLLERDASVQAEEDIVQAKDWQLETVMDWDSGFAEYAQATQSLEDLTNLQQELLANVETFDTLVAPAPQPPRVQRKAASPDSTAEARRAKRKAARAGGSAAVQSAVADAPAPASDLEASIELLAGMRQQLDSLILHPAQPAEEVKPQPQSRTKRSAVPAASPSQTADLQHDAQAQMPSLDLEREAEHTARRKHKLRASRNSRAVSSVSEPDAAHAASRPSRSSNADGTTHSHSTPGSNTGAAAQLQPHLPRTGAAVPACCLSCLMQMATSTKVLGPDEQKELAVMVKDYLGLKTVQRQLANILKRPPTAAECARALKSDLREYQARFDAGQQAKALMLKTNYRLVISVVKKYQNRGINMQDLITEGMQGLLKGVEKFEPEKGFRFSTYAHWWIRQAVSRALQDQSRAVR